MKLSKALIPALGVEEPPEKATEAWAAEEGDDEQAHGHLHKSREVVVLRKL